MFRNPQIINRLWSEEIEQGLLGCILANPDNYEDVAWFNPNWFYVPVHARIFDAIAKHKADGKAVSPMLIAQYFSNDRDIDAAGGAAYLKEMAEAYSWSRAAKDYAQHLRALHLRRMLVEKSDEIKEMSANADPFTSAEQILDHAEKVIAEAREVRAHDTAKSLKDGVLQALESARNPARGISSGIPSLDKFTRGFQAGSLYVLAGRPGMGKTALGLTVSANAALSGKKTLFFSLEMPGEQINHRLLSRFCNSAVHSGIVPFDTGAAVERISGLPMDVDDAAGLTALDIIARATQHRRRKGLDLVVVDYLGLVMPTDRKMNKVHQVEEITQAMKRMAKDLSIPVILLCQLSRAVEGRDDKRPSLADLRDSGAIEQDADVVGFIFREEYYADRKTQGSGRFKGRIAEAADMADEEAMKGAAEIIVAKNRQGILGTAHLQFNGEAQYFYE